jgi:hypothetical protein
MQDSANILLRNLPVTAKAVKKITGTVSFTDYTVLPDKIVVTGVLIWQLFYVGDDDLTHISSGEIPFSTIIPVNGASEGMTARLSGEIENISAVILQEGSQVNIKAVIRITVVIDEKSPISLAPNGTTDVVAEIIINENSAQTMVSEEFSLKRNAKKIFIGESKTTLESIETGEDIVVAQGKICLGISYVGEDDITYYEKFNIPISGLIEMLGALPGMEACVSQTLETSKVALTSSNGFSFQAVVSWDARLTDTIVTQITPAASGDEYRILLLVGSEVDIQHMVNAQITLEKDALKIREVKTHISELKAEVITNKVIISGILSKEIYYVGTDGINYSQLASSSFSTFVDYPGALPGHEALIDAEIEHEYFELIDDRLLLIQTLLKLWVKVVDPVSMPIATDGGITVLLSRIVGQNSIQLILDGEETVEESITVKKALIVLTSQREVSSQTQILRRINATPPAESVVESRVYMENVTAIPMENKVEIRGDVISIITYMGTDKENHELYYRGSFSSIIPVEGLLPSDSVSAVAEASHYDIGIIFAGSKILEVIDIRIQAEIYREQIQEVVTDVIGPHITTEKVLVRVRIPSGETVEMFVVTQVWGPKITVIKKSMVLDVVGEGPKEIEVVVDVII